MKTKVNLNLSIKKTEGHTSQIVTGFIMLRNHGLIDLEITRSSDQPYASIVEAIINNKIRVIYDVADQYLFHIDHFLKYVQGCDLYFKRSFDKTENEKYKLEHIMYPLGLNYHVTIEDNILDKPHDLNIFHKAKWFAKDILKKTYYRNFTVEHFEQTPLAPSDKPQVLFTTRTWSNEGSHEKEETFYIDNMRASIIRKLRKELGNQFIGGFSNRDHAVKNFADCIVDESITERTHYMQLVKQADICISTMGLWKSNGWKLGEYVAASKAIVSETLRYEVTGDFKAGHNYLEFTSADQCVEQTVKLMNDKDLMHQMKVRNHVYYNNSLRPDKLILNTLDIVLSGEDVRNKKIS